MSYTLIIVESPSKAQTFRKYLDDGYKVVASFGHVMDLPEKEFGIEIENGFKPNLIVTKKGSKIVKEIKSLAKNASKIILAADPDREGEAICFHLESLLSKNKATISRIELHEITKNALFNALKSQGKINSNLVESQMTRRILDRIVGYRLSPLLWKNLFNYKLSAGRVQSVVLRWICEREIEIKNFIKEEYWALSVNVESENKDLFTMQLKEQDGRIKTKEQAMAIWAKIFDNKLNKKLITETEINVREFHKKLKISKVDSLLKKKFPPPPFITASLQKEAGGKLKFSTKKTMSVALKLYEGVYTGNEYGTTGLITYMRTDSSRLSNEFQNKAKSFIIKNLGEKFAGNYKLKKSNSEVQDAHEAIRPSNLEITPDKLRDILPKDQWSLYELIWKRTIASLMSPEESLSQRVEANILNYTFYATGKTVLFEGFTSIYSIKKEISLPELKLGDSLGILVINSDQKFSEPPPRFTEASLVEKMEKEGVGRPSTYSSTIEVLYKRGYANLNMKSLVPTELGNSVNSFLNSKISYLFETGFTRIVEEDLDKIAGGKLGRVEFLTGFYDKFQTEFTQIESQKPISKRKQAETELICPICHNKLLRRKKPKGKAYFICSSFPNCEYMVYAL